MRGGAVPREHHDVSGEAIGEDVRTVILHPFQPHSPNASHLPLCIITKMSVVSTARGERVDDQTKGRGDASGQNVSWGSPRLVQGTSADIFTSTLLRQSFGEYWPGRGPPMFYLLSFKVPITSNWTLSGPLLGRLCRAL